MVYGGDMTGLAWSKLKNLVLVLQGQAVSGFGNHLYDMAMLLWIKEATGSAAVMGLAMLLTHLPEAVLAPLGGCWPTGRAG